MTQLGALALGVLLLAAAVLMPERGAKVALIVVVIVLSAYVGVSAWR